ncbi:MAG TPA: hypothetical protein VMW48_08975 [Vicinamibacterales bacterium]|nr:hypothetical protein [Vicinamibacterales bacterium]
MKFKVRGLALAMAAVLVAGLPSAALAQKDGKKRSKQEKQEIETIVKTVDAAMAGTPGPTDVEMKIAPVFLKSQEARVFVPFTIELSGLPQKDAVLYIRVVDPTVTIDPKKKVEYTWDDVHFVPAAQLSGSPMRLNRVFMATPGTYDVYIMATERLPEKAPKNTVVKAGLLKTSVTVPDLAAEFTTSSILVADKVTMLTQPLTMDEARERPFSFGLQELEPAADNNFTKAEELSIFFQVYNPGLNANGKPDLTLEYNFHRTEGGEEKFFNKTNPQAINESNLPPQFDPAKFPVPGGITVPLKSFGEGEYRLEIKVTDKTSNKVLTRNVPFTVKG